MELQQNPVEMERQENAAEIVVPPAAALPPFSFYRVFFFVLLISASSLMALSYYEMHIHFGVKIAIGITILIYLAVPAAFHFSVTVQRHLVFLPWARWPHNVNFSSPETEGLEGARNFYLTPEPGISVGVWHILPRSFVARAQGRENEFWEDALRDSKKPVIVYMHGNTGSRAGPHRKELYKILQSLDYHILCLDYRGYADSTNVPPSETGVVTDAQQLYQYVRRVVGNSTKSPKIIAWGHSLGTGVSSHMVANLCLAGGDKPDALILESPFTSIGEEVRYHSLSAGFRYLPGFDYIFIRPLRQNDLAFQSDVHISNIDIPIAILHATDDPVIPYHLATTLFNIGLQSRRGDAPPIYFKTFPDGFGHTYICRSPDLPPLVTNFVNCVINNTWPCFGFDNDAMIEEQDN